MIFDAGIGFSDSELVYSSCFKPLESKKLLIARSLRVILRGFEFVTQLVNSL